MTALKMGCNIRFKGIIWKIIPKTLSLLSLLICSTVNLLTEDIKSLLDFLDNGASRIKFFPLKLLSIETEGKHEKHIQSNFNGSNTFGTMKISSRQG